MIKAILQLIGVVFWCVVFILAALYFGAVICDLL